jgi:putative FmdB family regulatory protein
MPLYDFRCCACDARFEARARADELPACPECGTAETERLLSPFAGPFTVAARGLAARRSNAVRQAREEQRLERREERRRERAERGDAAPPRRPRPG